MANPEVYDDMKLYVTPDNFYIEPTVNPREVLVIDRISGTPQVVDRSRLKTPIADGIYRPVCGILGTIRLLTGNHLVVVTHRVKVGKINGQDVYQMAGTDIIPYANTTVQLMGQQMEDNRQYLKMIATMLETPYFYFSYEYDLTHTLQRLFNTSPEFLQMSLMERADPRFLWNSHLLHDFKAPQFKRFALPIVMGFISITACVINGKMFTWSIVSRRSVNRAGPRLFMRGIDSAGNVANYVETEQIIESEGFRSSFVQTRGSIPLFWSQLPDLKYKPRPRLHPVDQLATSKLHFVDQIKTYGPQVLVNLIDQRGAEESLEKEYRNIVSQLNDPSVRYEAFDFHAECGHMKWERLNILIDRLAHEQDEFGYFLLGRNGIVISQQSGVFRTNCIDCLDRTNVVQSMFAKRSLNAVLKRLEILRAPNDSVDNHDNLSMLFKRVWADNADFISIQYSGTGALKTDFTRTGKRTKLGIFRDIVNSTVRYYKNNFADGFRQDAFDLFLGHYKVQEGEGVSAACPLHKDKGWKYLAFPTVLLVALSMFFASSIVPSGYSTETLLYIMFWGGMVASIVTLIFKYGKEFVDYPKLTEITFPSQRQVQDNQPFPL